jgi:hypothetical protein
MEGFSMIRFYNIVLYLIFDKDLRFILKRIIAIYYYNIKYENKLKTINNKAKHKRIDREKKVITEFLNDEMPPPKPEIYKYKVKRK